MLIKDVLEDEFDAMKECLDGMDRTARTDDERKLTSMLRDLMNDLGSIDHDDNPQQAIQKLLESSGGDIIELNRSVDDGIRQRRLEQFEFISEMAAQASLDSIKEMKEHGISAKHCYKIMTSRAVRSGLKIREDMLKQNLSESDMEKLDHHGEKTVRNLKKMAKKQIEEVYGVSVGKKKKRRK